MKKLFAILAALAISLPAWAADPTVEMKTNYGAITIELYPEKAPARKVQARFAWRRKTFLSARLC